MKNYVQYDNSTFAINWIFTRNGEWGLTPDEGCTIIEVSFYNDQLLDCFYYKGEFYKDAELQIKIENPETYIKEIIELN